MNEHQKVDLTPREIDIAELSILILLRTSLDGIVPEKAPFSARESEAIAQAKARMLRKMDDQIIFKRNQLTK